jgi:signal transduction histidine kinase
MSGSDNFTISGEPLIPVEYSKSIVVNITMEGDATVFSLLNIDKGTYSEAIKMALASGSASGELSFSGRSWRFIIEQEASPFAAYAYSIVYLDIDDTNKELRELAASLVVIGIIAIGAVSMISMLVANRAMRPVEESMARQRRFVADASHELKTPIAVIAANAEAASGAVYEADRIITANNDSDTDGSGFAANNDGDADDAGFVANNDGDADDLGFVARNAAAKPSDISRWIDNIADEANRMNKLVENLLALAKSDEKPAERYSFDLVGAVCEEADRIEAFLFEKSISFNFEVKGNQENGSSVTVVSDRTKVQAIVSVLLENAMKYTPTGGRVLLVIDKGSVAVSNTGEYIPPEKLDHLFDRFFRADLSRNSENGGHGIGLSIAKQFTDMLGARLAAESVPQAEGGAVNTFTLYLPG